MVFSFVVNLFEVDNVWVYVVVYGILILVVLGLLYFFGGEFVWLVWEVLCVWKISIDLLFFVILVGVLGGLLIGMFMKIGLVYYEVVVVLIVVYMVGKMFGVWSWVLVLCVVDWMWEKFDVCEVVCMECGGVEGGGVLVEMCVKVLKGGEIVCVVLGVVIVVDGEIVSGCGYV